jgi:hypothetical protein
MRQPHRLIIGGTVPFVLVIEPRALYIRRARDGAVGATPRTFGP